MGFEEDGLDLVWALKRIIVDFQGRNLGAWTTNSTCTRNSNVMFQGDLIRSSFSYNSANCSTRVQGTSMLDLFAPLFYGESFMMNYLLRTVANDV